MSEPLFTYRVEYLVHCRRSLSSRLFTDYDAAVEFMYDDLPRRGDHYSVWLTSISHGGHEALLCHYSTLDEEHVS